MAPTALESTVRNSGESIIAARGRSDRLRIHPRALRRSRVAVVALAVTWGGCASAPAANRPPRAGIGLRPYVVMVGGNAADLTTTHAALETGRGHEGNPAWRRRDIGTLTVAKIGGVAALAVVMRTLETHGHPRAAKILGYVDGALTFGVAAHNGRIAWRH